MTTKEAINELERRRPDLQTNSLYAEAVDYAIKTLKETRKEDLISLVCKAGPDGLLHIYEVPQGQEDGIYGKILHTLSDIFRRLGLRYCDKVSKYFYTPEYKGCKSCYHRAEYIVHGCLCGLVAFTVLAMILEWLVIHR